MTVEEQDLGQVGRFFIPVLKDVGFCIDLCVSLLASITLHSVLDS